VFQFTDVIKSPVIVWFRKDLRLIDNPALAAAVSAKQPVVPLFILDDDTHSNGDWAVGAASRWWLDGSLRSLATSLEQQLTADSIDVESFNGSLLNEPWEIKTGSHSPYLVFTPYWKAVLRHEIHRQPIVAAATLAEFPDTLPSDSVDDWNLTPSRPDWADGFRENWTPGEKGAWHRLKHFLDAGVGRYVEGRDRPDRRDTSMLSPHLHFGEISPLSIWQETVQATESDSHLREDGLAFLREIGWREFCHSLLFYNPTLPDSNLKPEFDAFPWLDDDTGLRAWQKGVTGFPIVDAGMRQLWHTGWMHNRVRMIAASFLIKDLMIHWRHGEQWFWDTLVDADLANNAAGWQWVAGSGADASPWFRVFNPTTQGKKFDPDGDYVRHWVPELTALPKKYIHEPASAPQQVLAEAGIELGVDYPNPLVDHKQARLRALAAWETVRSG